MTADIRRSVTAGLRALEEAQLPDGSFPLAGVPSDPPPTVSDNLFSTAMIVALLPSQLRPESVSRAARYLLDRRTADGLWSWTPDGSIPPDADDTACCLGALIAAGAPLDRDEEARRLRRFWRFTGPFRTWDAGGMWAKRHSDDAVVNCNVLWAMQELGITSRRRERWAVARIVGRTRGATRYYCSAASVAWAAARVGIRTPQLIAPSESALAGRPLEAALWSLASPQPLAGRLLVELQEADGGWAAEPWVRAYVGAWESRAVTTAFAVAALSRMLRPD